MASLDPQRLLRHTDWLRVLARELVADLQRAEDVVQDTCVAALEHPPRSAVSDVGLRTWLATVLRNLVYMQARGDQRRRTRERKAAHAERLPSVAEAVERVAVQREIVDAVLDLDPEDRDVVVLRFFEELPPRVIAERLGLSGSAVRSRLSRALAKLRARLDQSHGGDGRSWAVALMEVARHTRPTGLMAKTVAGSLIMNGLAKATLVAAVLLTAAFVWVRLDPLGNGADEFSALKGPGPVAQERADLAPLTHAGIDESQALAQRNEVRLPDQQEATPTQTDQPRLVVHGRFVDPDQQPIAGVRLTAWNMGERPWATSGPDGRVVLDLDWPLAVQNQRLLLVMAGKGWTRQYREEKLTGPGVLELGDLRLAPGGILVGFVRDPGGSPVVDARVGAVTAVGDAVRESEEYSVWGRAILLGPNLYVSTHTDEAGAYRLEGVPLTQVSVTSWAPGRYRARTPALLVERGQEVRAPDLILRGLEADNTIRGEVRDAKSQPIPGVQVRAYPNRDLTAKVALTRAPTDASGQFELPVVADRFYSVLVSAPGHPLGVVQHDVRAGRPDLIIDVQAPRTLSVVITDVAGELVAEPSVQLFDLAGEAIGVSPERGSNGVLLVPLPPVFFQLQVASPSHLTANLGPFDPDALPSELLVTLESAGILSGRVSAEGLPVANARLHLHRPPSEARFGTYADERFSELVELFTALDPRTWQEVRSDSGGNFELPSPGAGTFVIHAEAEGHGRGQSRSISLESGESRAGIELELPTPSTIFGRVLVAAGVEVEGTVVGITRGDGHVRTQTVGKNGAYSFEGLASGRWQVRRCEPAALESLRKGRIRAQPEMTSLPHDLQLPSGSRVEFDLDLLDELPCRVSGSLTFDGIPAEGWQVHLGIQGEQVLMHTDAEGLFRATVRRPGHGFLGAMSSSAAARWVVVTRPVELVAGDNVFDLDFVTGTVSLSGLPLSPMELVGPYDGSYSLRFLDPQDQTLWFLLFDPEEDGSRTLSGIPVGVVHLHRRTLESQGQDPSTWPRLETLTVEQGRNTNYVWSADDD